MILFSYILLANPPCKNAFVKIFSVYADWGYEKETNNLKELVQAGRLNITDRNIVVIDLKDGVQLKKVINENSAEAA